MEKLEKLIEKLRQRGVEIRDISKIVYDAQVKYTPNITLSQIDDVIIKILNKREVYHAMITGLELDILSEHKALSKELNDILEIDEPLYGIDEILALSITNLYGTIALTNFGYFDKVKPGIIGELNVKENGICHTFLDDLMCAVAAAACSKLAHNV